MFVFGDLGVLGKPTIPFFLKFRTCEKANSGSRDTAMRTEAAGVFFPRRRVVFRSRFRPNRGNSWRSENFTLCLNMSSFLKFQTCGPNFCGSERI
jgi:hypothetical protein